MAESTPGPWKVESFGSPRVLATDEKGAWPVCDIRGWGHLTGHGVGALGLDPKVAAAIQDANARLIAAAPDMLEALRNVQQIIAAAAMVGFNCHDGDWADRLFLSQQKTSAAIKKATSEHSPHVSRSEADHG